MEINHHFESEADIEFQDSELIKPSDKTLTMGHIDTMIAHTVNSHDAAHALYNFSAADPSGVSGAVLGLIALGHAAARRIRRRH